MTDLLIVAHGSRREASNEEIRQLAAQLGSYDSAFAQISCGFLEIASPSIPEALLAMIANGSQSIVVMPYFLSAGRHVSTDIPAEIAQVQTQAPEIEIRLAPYLGAAEQIASLLLQQASLGLIKS